MIGNIRTSARATPLARCCFGCQARESGDIHAVDGCCHLDYRWSFTWARFIRTFAGNSSSVCLCCVGDPLFFFSSPSRRKTRVVFLHVAVPYDYYSIPLLGWVVVGLRGQYACDGWCDYGQCHHHYSTTTSTTYNRVSSALAVIMEI